MRDKNDVQVCKLDLNIALDAEVIQKIDHTKIVLQDISTRIEDQKKIMRDIEKQEDEVSESLITTIDLNSSSVTDIETNSILGSAEDECTRNNSSIIL